MSPNPAPLLPPGQEEFAVKTVTDLDREPVMSMHHAQAIGKALSVSEQRGREILDNLFARNLARPRFENPANNLAETGHVVVNRFVKWFRVSNP